MVPVNYNHNKLVDYFPGFVALQDDPKIWLSHLNKISDLASNLLYTKILLDSERSPILPPDKVVKESIDSYDFVFGRLLRNPLDDHERESLHCFLHEHTHQVNVSSAEQQTCKIMGEITKTVDTIYAIYLQTPPSIQNDKKWVSIESELIEELEEVFPKKKAHVFGDKVLHDCLNFIKHPVKSLLSGPRHLQNILKASLMAFSKKEHVGEGVLRASSVVLPAFGIGTALFASSLSVPAALPLVLIYGATGYLLHTVADVTWPKNSMEDIALSTNQLNNAINIREREQLYFMKTSIRLMLAEAKQKSKQCIKKIREAEAAQRKKEETKHKKIMDLYHELIMILQKPIITDSDSARAIDIRTQISIMELC